MITVALVHGFMAAVVHSDPVELLRSGRGTITFKSVELDGLG